MGFCQRGGRGAEQADCETLLRWAVSVHLRNSSQTGWTVLLWKPTYLSQEPWAEGQESARCKLGCYCCDILSSPLVTAAVVCVDHVPSRIEFPASGKVALPEFQFSVTFSQGRQNNTLLNHTCCEGK